MAAYKPEPEEKEKDRLKSCLAAAAPALIPLVMIVSTDSLTMMRVASLDRIGLLAAVVVLVTLGFFLFRRRWWAGLPSMMIFIFLGGLFLIKAFRPLYAYFSVNSFNGPQGGLTPLLMVSPALVILLMAAVLGRLTLRGMVRARREGPAPVSRAAWGVLIIWAALLIGDAAYQETGWRYVRNPGDVVLKLCAGDEAERAEAERILLEMGDEAAPALQRAMKVQDPGLRCLRERSEEVWRRISLGEEQQRRESARR